MHRFRMKLLYLFCCLLAFSGLSAQDPSYFVYIQHEKQQPFYVKIDGKLLSSSERGYVILPKLQAGKVPVTVGFPKSEAPEQQFVIRLNGSRDYGYLLKNTGDEKYALYDLQTFASLKAGGGAPAEEEVAVARISDENATPEQKELINNVQADVEAALGKNTDSSVDPQEPKKKNSFATALDKVVKDDRPDDMPLEFPQPKPAAPAPAAVEEVATTVMEAPAPKRSRNRKRNRDRAPLTAEEKELLKSVMEEEKRAAADEALRETANTAEVKADSGNSDVQPIAEEPVKPKKEKRSKKKRNQPEPEFIDFGTEGAATVPAAAPVERTVEATAEAAGETAEMSAKEAREAKRQKRKAEREIAIREGEIRDSIANAEFNRDVEAVTEKSDKKMSSVSMVNSDCEKVLEVDAFRKLLRNMNGRKTDEDMVDAFRRGTRNVCVSTEQLRALAQLISTEENRYQLLDAAYPRTYDSQNFAELGDLLKDDYYKGRFKAMIKK